MEMHKLSDMFVSWFGLEVQRQNCKIEKTKHIKLKYM